MQLKHRIVILFGIMLFAKAEAQGPIGTYQKPITVSVSYTEDQVVGMDESQLKLYYQNPQNGAWEALQNCTVDTEKNIINCTIQAALFGLFQPPQNNTQVPETTTENKDLNPETPENRGDDFVAVEEDEEETVNSTSFNEIIEKNTPQVQSPAEIEEEPAPGVQLSFDDIANLNFGVSSNTQQAVTYVAPTIQQTYTPPPQQQIAPSPTIKPVPKATPTTEEEKAEPEVRKIFPDLENEGKTREAVEYLRNAGIIQGYDDGNFKGEQYANRAEILKMLLFKKPSKPSTLQLFPDVDFQAWYSPYVQKGLAHGIVHGYGDGYFRPEKTINTVEFLKMITKTYNLEENLPFNYKDIMPEAWYTPYLGIVAKYDLFPTRQIANDILKPNWFMTRSEAAIAIYLIETKTP